MYLLRLTAILLCPAALAAQGFPIELFAGYSYAHIPEEPGGLTASGLSGWQAAVKLKFRDRIGWVFDGSGGYGTRRMVPSGFQTRETLLGAVRQHAVLLGPEVRVWTGKRLAVNARALIGALYVAPLRLPLREPFVPGPPDPRPLVTEFTIGRAKPLAGAAASITGSPAGSHGASSRNSSSRRWGT